MKTIEFHITEHDIEQYAYVSGDFNPIHLDLEEAKRQGFSNKIAHGMLTMARIISVLSQELLSPNITPYKYDFSFLSPVYVGDQVTLTISKKDLEYRIEGKAAGKTVVKGFLLLREKTGQ